MHEVTVSINGYSIVLPIGLEQPIKDKVRNSYQDFLQDGVNDVRRHLTALTTMLPKHLYAGDVVLHCFGGVGATAQVINQAVPYVQHVFWERDPVLVEYLTSKGYQAELVKDSYALLPTIVQRYDAVMFDPSVGSIKTTGMKEVWKALERMAPRLVWLSDTACSKIHLNADYYRKDFGGRLVKPTAEGYLAAYHQWLISEHGFGFVEAMREAQEMYAIITRNPDEYLPTRIDPIPYM